MPTSTTPWDAADHINTSEDVATYLEAAFEEHDPALIPATLRNIARSKGITAVAEKAGLPVQILREALGPDGDPPVSKLMELLKVLGLRLTVVQDRAA